MLVKGAIGLTASISSLPFSKIPAVITFQHIEKVFADQRLLTLFWKHFNMLERLDCQKFRLIIIALTF